MNTNIDVVEEFNRLISETNSSNAFKWLVSIQDNPEHIRSLLMWAKRFIECGHIVTPGFCFIGTLTKWDKNEHRVVVVKEKTKVGTHSGYLSYKFSREEIPKPYYGWHPDELDNDENKDNFSVKLFNKYALWLMKRPYHVMREEDFVFNSLHFHTNNSTILDIDSYKNESQKAIVDMITSLIPDNVPRVRSQNGGLHYYFRKTLGVSGLQKFKIDMLQNGFVFAPPTKVRGGGTYMFENISKPEDFPQELPEMPLALQMYFNKNNQNIYPKQAPRKTYTGPITARQLSIVDKLASEADNTMDRSANDFSTIKWCQSIGMSADDAFDKVKDHGKFKERGRAYFDTTWNNALRR